MTTRKTMLALALAAGALIGTASTGQAADWQWHPWWGDSGQHVARNNNWGNGWNNNGSGSNGWGNNGWGNNGGWNQSNGKKFRQLAEWCDDHDNQLRRGSKSWIRENRQKATWCYQNRQTWMGNGNWDNHRDGWKNAQNGWKNDDWQDQQRRWKKNKKNQHDDWQEAREDWWKNHRNDDNNGRNDRPWWWDNN